MATDVTAYELKTVADRGVDRSCDPLKNFGGFWVFNHIISLERLNLTSSHFVNKYGKLVLATELPITKKVFVVIQRVSRVCQRQLSYL